MLAMLLLFATFGLLPQWPVFAALTLWGAFASASRWGPAVGETLELVGFYGALSGVLLVLLGY